MVCQPIHGLLQLSQFSTRYFLERNDSPVASSTQQSESKIAKTDKPNKTEWLQKHEFGEYNTLSFEQLKSQLEQEGYDLRGCDDEETKCLLCLKAGIVMVDGQLLNLDEIVSVAYCNNEWWDSYDGYTSEKADIYGTYEKESESPVVYDYEESGESTSYTVNYIQNGEQREIKLIRDGYTRYWMLGLLQYVKERGEEAKKLKERMAVNMVAVEGFDYPFFISRFKLSQEEYNVIMDVVKPSNDVADKPYATNKWNQYVGRYQSGQKRDDIDKILARLKEKTGKTLRLPTLKECEYVNNLEISVLGFRLENELCEVGSGYLCTESKGIYVSDPMHNDLPPYKSFRLVDCKKCLSDIDYADDTVLENIRKRMDDEKEYMHYFWEN